MTNLCTKVSLRKKPLANGMSSLYLDFYPPIRSPKTGKKTRRETLGMYIYTDAKERFKIEYNRQIMQSAEMIRCQRSVDIINRKFGFIDRNADKADFLEYYARKMKEYSNDSNWQSAYKLFSQYCNGKCSFGDLTVDFCQGFLDFLLGLDTQKGRKMMATTANGHLRRLRSILHAAFDDGLIDENIGTKLKMARNDAKPKEYLTLEEVKALSATPCKAEVLRRASLFSCLTGLRISDILNLKWENIVIGMDGEWCMHIITQKTKTEAMLPISDEALALCGERQEGTVFKGLSKSMVQLHLGEWIREAGITKHVTFHTFRHTFATLQIAAGTDIYTVSKLLTHSNVSTTQVYAAVVNEKKREAAARISLE